HRSHFVRTFSAFARTLSATYTQSALLTATTITGMTMTNPPSAATWSYVDRPEVSETFVDSLEKISFDGTSIRLELTVNRFDSPHSTGVWTGRKVTACRLITNPSGLLSIAGALNNLIASLQQQGILKIAGTPMLPGEKATMN